MPTFSGTDDPQLVQELIHKNKQVEVMHGQLKQYADSLDREKRKISMLTMENLNYQQQLQQFQTVPPFPPRSPVHVSNENVIVLFYHLLIISIIKLNQCRILTEGGKEIVCIENLYITLK